MIVKRMFRAGMTSLLACASLVWMTSCMDNDDDQTQPTPVAFVSLYNASPNAPDLEIVVDDKQINSNPFEYADYTGYLRFFTGERNLKFGPFGANNVVVDTTVMFENDKAYSVYLVDEYTKASVMILNDNSEKPATGKAKVRFLNLSPDAGETGLVVNGETDALFEGQAFKESSDFIEVAANKYDFNVTSNGATGDVILDIPEVDLQEGWFYTIIVRGYKTPPGGNTNVVSAQVIVN